MKHRDRRQSRRCSSGGIDISLSLRISPGMAAGEGDVAGPLARASFRITRSAFEWMGDHLFDYYQRKE